MYKSKEIFFSIKFKQHFYFNRFLPWEKISERKKVVFQTKLFFKAEQSSLNIKAPKGHLTDRQNTHIMQKPNLAVT